MPNKITKEEALKLLSKERERPDNCLICEILDSNINEKTLYEDENIIAFLSKYPRFWGHTIIATKKHLESFTEIPKDLYFNCFFKAREMAILLEEKLNPVNVYVSSIGSKENKINTCPHFHIHILPTYDKEIKPSAVFSWNDGIYQGSEEDWVDRKSVV